MDSMDRSFDYSFSVDSPVGLNQGFLLNPDHAVDSNMSSVIPDTPSPQPSKRRRGNREEPLSPQAVSDSTSEESCFIRKRRSLRSRKRRCLAPGRGRQSVSAAPASPEQSAVDFSPPARISPEEINLSAASSPSSSVELDTLVVDSPVASPSAAHSPSPEANRRRRKSLTMAAASSASPLPASLQSDFLFSLTDMERRQLCGGSEADLAAVTEILDSSHARLEQEQADEEYARYLQTQFDEEEASSLQQQRSHRYHRSAHHNPRRRDPRNSDLGRFLHSPDALEGDYEALLEFEEQQGAVVVRKLSSREISRYPTKKFRSSACAESPACNICLCDYADGEKLRTLPCLHNYHVDCIDHWLKDKPICPVCRTDLTDSDILDTQHS